MQDTLKTVIAGMDKLYKNQSLPTNKPTKWDEEEAEEVEKLVDKMNRKH